MSCRRFRIPRSELAKLGWDDGPQPKLYVVAGYVASGYFEEVL